MCTKRNTRNDPLKGNIYDLCSGWGIRNRKKRFYVKDKQGFYYIPEVQEHKGCPL